MLHVPAQIRQVGSSHLPAKHSKIQPSPCLVYLLASVYRGQLIDMSSNDLAGLRVLLLCNAALSDIMMNNVRNMARGERSRSWFKENWTRPTLLLFGAKVRLPQLFY